MQSAEASPESSRRWMVATTALVVIMLGIWYVWPSSKVTLNDDGYQMTLALYRICNQQDAEALAQLSDRLSETEASRNLDPQSRHTIASIISSAKSGQWKGAAIACRDALDANVQR